MQNWQQSVSNSEAARRAGGRRRYNKQRQREALQRQAACLNLWWYGRLSRKEIAQRLGVSQATISRYLTKGNHVRGSYTISYVDGRGWRIYGY